MDLGLERAGMSCRWQVEINDFAREQILETHFPNTRKYTDVNTVGKHNLDTVELICGGFPCQDISRNNSQGKGLKGNRSGLWREFYRILCELRPRYALIENSSNLVNRGLPQILSNLAGIGFDAEWICLQASDFNYPHERKRLFIVAYPNNLRLAQIKVFSENFFKPIEKQKHPFNFLFIENVGRFYPEIPCDYGTNDGLSNRLDNKTLEEITHGLGNAVVPAISEFIGKQILEFDRHL